MTISELKQIKFEGTQLAAVVRVENGTPTIIGLTITGKPEVFVVAGSLRQIITELTEVANTLSL